MVVTVLVIGVNIINIQYGTCEVLSVPVCYEVF